MAVVVAEGLCALDIEVQEILMVLMDVDAEVGLVAG